MILLYGSMPTRTGCRSTTNSSVEVAVSKRRFSMTSGAPYPNITRKFWSFSEAARENGASRILCGIHFATAVNAGYIQGEQIGEWVYEHALQPVKPQPAITASPVSEKAEH